MIRAQRVRRSWPVLLATLANACATPISEGDCLALLDRYTALLAQAQQPEASEQQIVDLQSKARELAQSEPVYEFHDCSKRVSRREFECAMRAPSVDEMERCLVF